MELQHSGVIDATGAYKTS